QQHRQRQQMEMRRSDAPGADDRKKPAKREAQKVGRNAPCPCCSGKKYKKCCGEAE
ncbi:MAG: SEC-C domain-containing protein, partial [Deltaproteobacteria bacterium]|nr:SEC-C domain-containing protein [Deltaproteobacteria bacterium]